MSLTEPTSAASIRPTDEDEIRTREGLDAIANEGRLGALLIQFPVSFKNTSLNREYLARLLRQVLYLKRSARCHALIHGSTGRSGSRTAHYEPMLADRWGRRARPYILGCSFCGLR